MLEGNRRKEFALLARLAHLVARRRWYIIGVWVVLTLFGGFAAGQVSKRWYQSFSIPGKSAYEANQRTLKAFGSGVRPPALSEGFPPHRAPAQKPGPARAVGPCGSLRDRLQGRAP